MGGADGEQELLGGGECGVDVELDAEPSVGGVVPAGDLQHATADPAVVSGGAVEGVVVDVFADVAHGGEPGERGVESHDHFVDLGGCRCDVGRDEGGSSESAQRDDEELEVGELAGQEVVVFAFGAVRAPQLQCDGPASFVGEVPTGAFILDYSRLDEARLCADEDVPVVEALRSDSINYSRDALIAATARFEHAHLITHERRLTGRARDHGIPVLTITALLELLDPKA